MQLWCNACQSALSTVLALAIVVSCVCCCCCYCSSRTFSSCYLLSHSGVNFFAAEKSNSITVEGLSCSLQKFAACKSNFALAITVYNCTLVSRFLLWDILSLSLSLSPSAAQVFISWWLKKKPLNRHTIDWNQIVMKERAQVHNYTSVRNDIQRDYEVNLC